MTYQSLVSHKSQKKIEWITCEWQCNLIILKCNSCTLTGKFNYCFKQGCFAQWNWRWVIYAWSSPLMLDYSRLVPPFLKYKWTKIISCNSSTSRSHFFLDILLISIYIVFETESFHYLLASDHHIMCFQWFALVVVCEVAVGRTLFVAFLPPHLLTSFHVFLLQFSSILHIVKWFRW